MVGAAKELIVLGVRDRKVQRVCPAGSTEDEDDDDYEADHRALVAPEPPGEVADAAPVFALAFEFCLYGVLSQLAPHRS